MCEEQIVFPQGEFPFVKVVKVSVVCACVSLVLRVMHNTLHITALAALHTLHITPLAPLTRQAALHNIVPTLDPVMQSRSQAPDTMQQTPGDQ